MRLILKYDRQLIKLTSQLRKKTNAGISPVFKIFMHLLNITSFFVTQSVPAVTSIIYQGSGTVLGNFSVLLNCSESVFSIQVLAKYSIL
jgi:hypothetical protein